MIPRALATYLISLVLGVNTAGNEVEPDLERAPVAIILSFLDSGKVVAKKEQAFLPGAPIKLRLTVENKTARDAVVSPCPLGFEYWGIQVHDADGTLMTTAWRLGSQPHKRSQSIKLSPKGKKSWDVDIMIWYTPPAVVSIAPDRDVKVLKEGERYRVRFVPPKFGFKDADGMFKGLRLKSDNLFFKLDAKVNPETLSKEEKERKTAYDDFNRLMVLIEKNDAKGVEKMLSKGGRPAASTLIYHCLSKNDTSWQKTIEKRCTEEKDFWVIGALVEGLILMDVGGIEKVLPPETLQALAADFVSIGRIRSVVGGVKGKTQIPFLKALLAQEKMDPLMRKAIQAFVEQRELRR